MKDGTYLIQPDGQVIDYAERWSYGYIVGVQDLSYLGGSAFITPGLVGVWTDTDDGRVYVDRVKHVDALSDALDLAREHGELAIWDLREEKEIRL
jgi:hypothetical protein